MSHPNFAQLSAREYLVDMEKSFAIFSSSFRDCAIDMAMESFERSSNFR